MIRISKNIANVALVTAFLFSTGCLGMEDKKDGSQRSTWQELAERGKFVENYNLAVEREAKQKIIIDKKLSEGMENILHQKEVKGMQEEEARFRLKQTKPTKQTKKEKITKIPTPKQITLISKEVIKNEIDAFRQKNVVPIIAMVPNLSIFNNPSVRQVKTIGSYTLFENENNKWIVDENGFDTGLETKAIQTMIDHDVLNETQIENNIYTMTH